MWKEEGAGQKKKRRKEGGKKWIIIGYFLNTEWPVFLASNEIALSKTWIRLQAVWYLATEEETLIKAMVVTCESSITNHIYVRK